MFQKPTNGQPQINPTQNHSKTHDDVETVVGPSVHVDGDFSSEGNILVKGIVSGEVKTSKLFTSEKGSKVLASVRAGDAVVSGSVKGNMKVDNRLELTESAQVLGDIDCGVLVMEAGALVKGKVTMKGIDIEDPKEAKKSSLLSRSSAKEVAK